MALPDDNSLFCDRCGCYNIQYGDCITINGISICDSCMKRLGLIEDFNELKEKLEVKYEV